MTEGLLWLDDNPKRDIADKVSQAADRYREKFGQQPDTCYIHESQVNGIHEVAGVRLVGVHNVLRYHFWIGVENELREAA